MDKILYLITPADLLSELGWKYRRKGKWFVLSICPFCDGGHKRDAQTCIVHTSDGNFSCLRSKCGAAGSFWNLLESNGYDPKEFIDRSAPKPKKRWMYK